MSEFGASGVLFVACLLLRERFPQQSRKRSPKFFPENSFPQKLFLTPNNFVYSDRGPAIASEEINETTRCG